VTAYTFHDLTLDVEQDAVEIPTGLTELLQHHSFVRSPAPVTRPSLRLSARVNATCRREVPRTARRVFGADDFCGLAEGFSGFDGGDDFYLTDERSSFHLRLPQGEGHARLHPSFLAKPPLLKQAFWVFGLVKLLRYLGAYGLHAAGVVMPDQGGLLAVGQSGSGKSTIAMELIRQRWSYLSDDSVLLRNRAEGVEALAFRKDPYIDADAGPKYPDLPLGPVTRDAFGRDKRRVCVDDAFPERRTARCWPRVLLFCRIVPVAQSTLRPLDRLAALKTLLGQSGPLLFDPQTMPQHLEVLKRLLQQTATVELEAGLDLHHDPRGLIDLLAGALRVGPCLGS